MGFRFRIPSLRKKIAARTSWRRFIRHALGLKAPRGWGWLTNPARALRNRIYYRTTTGCGTLVLLLAVGFATTIVLSQLTAAVIIRALK